MRWVAVLALLLGGVAAAVPFVSAREATNLLLWSEALDNAAWTSTGTPVVTADTWDFGVGDLTGDTIADDDGAVSESRNQALSTSVAGAYTVSCHVQSGTASAMRLQVLVTGGTGSNECTFSDLSTSTQRKTCSATAGSGVTAVTALVKVGTGAAATGSIKVGGCQIERATFAGPYCATTSAAARCVQAPATAVANTPPLTEG